MWLGARYGGAVSKRLGGFFTWQLWFTPWVVPLSDRARAREASWVKATTPLRIPYGRRHLNGFAAGSGPTVLLVHGWGDQASRLGAFVQRLVNAGFRVVGVDLPAHGSSPGLRADAYRVAEAITATAEFVGGVDAVVAHSMGGVETLMALKRGLKVRRIVLLASARRMEQALRNFQAMLAVPQRSMDGLAAAIERRYGTTVWDDLSADLLVRDLDVPALLFHDRSDRQVAFDEGKALHAAWHGSRFIATQGLGHDRLVRDPDVVRAAVEFLADGLVEDWVTVKPSDPAAVSG